MAISGGNEAAVPASRVFYFHLWPRYTNTSSDISNYLGIFVGLLVGWSRLSIKHIFYSRGMAGFSDRIGILAYALTPLNVLLSSRESILSVLTGISYRISISSTLSVYQTFIAEPYIIWGSLSPSSTSSVSAASSNGPATNSSEIPLRRRLALHRRMLGSLGQALLLDAFASLILVLDLGLHILGISGETSRLATLSREIEACHPHRAVWRPRRTRDAESPRCGGRTGISFALPLVIEAAGSEKHKKGLGQLVWVVRRARDLAEGGPMEGEVEEDEVVVVEAKDSDKLETVVDVEDENPKTEISVAVSALVGESRGFSVTYLGGTHPDLGAAVQDYVERSPASGGYKLWPAAPQVLEVR
ncbi:hypothetical protein GMDG_06738 [Pseudogymnoascus destructans 20631-21]|uniref:Uncharacterized protein n=2 Tax=Pseudogymnoascus destructans TaxID=655981 RepID=L8FV52_PSED2|nr:hypothetical protein GMDG_06738 [Pseudogymnoascus destructans 20631-21]